MSRSDHRTLPPSIADARGGGFFETMRQALDEPDFKALLFERIESVPDSVLPLLVREFSIEEFVEPGMTAAAIRRLLKGSYELHASKGFISGVRRGLELLGLRIIRWEQWFQTEPQKAPGTHRVLLAMSAEVFVGEGETITARMSGAVRRMIAGMQRHSQDITAAFAAESAVPVYVGALVVTRLRMRPLIPPISHIASSVPTFVGAAFLTRVRVTPGAPI